MGLPPSSPSPIHDKPPPSNPINNFQYPFASAPDIIRSNQKDTYFQGVLFEQLATILRKLYGARFIHNYTSEARTFTELLYLGCTTLIGNRTLGEEYCDIIQVENDTLRLPSIIRRAGYILSTVLLPYLLTKLLPGFRTRVRLRVESSLHSTKQTHQSLTYRLKSYILPNLSTLTSPSPLYALGLSIFYFSGSYYHIGKRLSGLRYIFTKRLSPSDQRIGYEVLGVLLVLQMAVQGYLHLHSTLTGAPPPVLANTAQLGGGTALLDGNVEIPLNPHPPDHLLLDSSTPTHHSSATTLSTTTSTPILPVPRYPLKESHVLGWIEGRQQRKCTLCLEEMRDPSATTCGHVFCWTCIADWIKEKPECPLCRQGILAQHVLPLRG